jgi:hypothetical protein
MQRRDPYSELEISFKGSYLVPASRLQAMQVSTAEMLESTI